MKVAIASGKGGTGKTTVALNLAYALAESGQKVRLLDCDVEEPNDHLFVRPDFTQKIPVCVMKPCLDQDACIGCGECARACQYNAIAAVKGKILIFSELCCACGVCSYVCPVQALTEKPAEIGWVRVASDNHPFFFVYGSLNVKERAGPTIIQAVKQYIDPNVINILDSCPGASCSVVETVDNADIVVLVTEPTPFGLHDLKLAVELTLAKGLPTGIIINRSCKQDEIITDYAKNVGLPIIGKISFRREYAEAYSKGQILTTRFLEFKKNMLEIFDRITELKGTEIPPLPQKESFGISSTPTDSLELIDASDCEEIAIISGKGGTGKTTVASSLAMLAYDKVLVDSDVDAADLHLLLRPTVKEVHNFVGGQKASVCVPRCTGCGKCATMCHFNAFRFDGPSNQHTRVTYVVDELACEGCSLCKYVCDVDAITLTPRVTGEWYISETDWGPMVHAQVGIQGENSGKLVTQVRSVASSIANQLHKKYILDDGPPGVGCPVIASISGVSLVLVVAEPSVSGVHDMKRVLDLTAHFGLRTFVIINKANINPKQAQNIENISTAMGSRVIGRIPFDQNVNDALIAGKTVIEYAKGPAFVAMHEIWDILRQEIL